MSLTLADIDAEFKQDNRKGSSKGIGGLPKWSIRLFLAIVLSLVFTLVLKPRMIMVVEYDVKTNQCAMKVKGTKALQFALLASPLFYFLVGKYY